MSGSIDMLIEMGFSKENAEKALSVTGNDVEAAMEWLLAHSETLGNTETNSTAAGDRIESQNSEMPTQESNSDGTTSAPSSTAESSDQTPKSIKCNECGKLFSTQVEVEFHAAKSGHCSFSESTEEKKPLTEEEKAEQMRKLEEKMKQKRKEREEKEKMEALEREKHRIKSGKEMIAAKKRLEDEEIRKMVEQRKREKMEDKLARERVKDQIEQDRLARKEKFGGSLSTSPSIQDVPASKPVTTSASQKDYSQTRLQIRLTNGQALTHTFGAKEQLSAVRLYVQLNRTDGSGPFSLMTSFPKKVFTEDDYDKPLDVLGLVPSAVVIVARAVA